MYELSRHIEKLLLTNDCVIVPKLGGFISQYKPASYNEKEGLFLPPHRCIGFNTQMQMNDGVLAQSFMEEYDVNYPESLAIINDKVNELKEALISEGKFVFEQIGLLTVNSQGQYKFYPSDESVLTPSLYGLESFKMEKYNDFHFMSEEKEVSTKKQYILRLNRNFVNYSVAVVISILFYFISAAPVSNNIHFGTNEASWANNVFNLCNFNKSKTTNTVSISSEISKESTASKIITIDSEKIKNKYAIVLASSVPLQNAKDYINEIGKEGYNKAYIYTHNNMRRILYSHYNTEKEAYRALKKLRESSRDRFADSWILKIK